jgi:5-methylcytosine-specific restriction protein A
MMQISDLCPGRKLENAELTSLFKVGISGGMRWSTQTKNLVLIADHTKNLYDDRWVGKTLYYTGMGKTGDQVRTGQNKRLADQPKTGVAVHLFEVFTKNEYIYDGLVRLSGSIQEEMQPDELGVPRMVLIFPLTLINSDEPAMPTRAELDRLARERQRVLATRPVDELRNLALVGGRQQPGSRSVTSTQYERNQAVVEYAKKAAGGCCDLCRLPAPFSTRSGPYLECHHLRPLAEGGPDTIENAVALCPNCHRKIHLINKSTDLDALRFRIKQREEAYESARF